MGPRETLGRAASLRTKALAAEAEALQAALAQSGGFEARAAELLGIGRTTLRYMLETRHKALRRFAEAIRKRAGYVGGKPKTRA